MEENNKIRFQYNEPQDTLILGGSIPDHVDATEKRIKIINQNPQNDWTQKIKDYLNETLGKNKFFEYSGWDDFQYEKSGYGVETTIERKDQLEAFLKFKNPTYKKIASEYLLKNSKDNFLMKIFCEKTTQTEDFKSTYQLLYDTFNILQKNNDVFSKENIESFINAYIDSLYKRTMITSTTFGLYHYDAMMLCYMTKYLKENNMPTDNIQKVLRNLYFQPTPFNENAKQETKIFNKAKSKIENNININKLYVKKIKLDFEKLVKRPPGPVARFFIGLEKFIDFDHDPTGL